MRGSFAGGVDGVKLKWGKLKAEMGGREEDGTEV